MSAEQKREALLQLAKLRQADRPPRKYHSLSEFHGGYYECDYISPWTISAHNVDAELMIIGQDWASSETLEGPPDSVRQAEGRDPSSRTNKNLKEFLKRFMRLEFSETYATNAFPLIKHGAKNKRILRADLEKYAETYAVPQIKIVSPRMTICLGKATFAAVRCAAKLGVIEWEQAIRPGPHTTIGSTEVYGVPHPSQQGLNNAGGKEAVGHIWKGLADRLQALRNSDQRR